MSENNCAVYVHVNLINGKKYFGITVQEPEARWGKNGKGYFNNNHFTNAINKYGWNNFAHYVLYRNIPIEIAKNVEEMLILEHMSYDPRFGYNKTYGGELEIPTEETREKMSAAKMGEKNPAKRLEVRRKNSEAHKGEKNPMKRPEVAAKISKARSEFLKNHPELNSTPPKPVEAIDPKTGLRTHYFNSTQDAGRAGFDPSAVVKCCKGKRKTHKRYIWRYVEEVSDNDSDSGQ